MSLKKLAQSALRKLMKILCGVLSVMRSQVMNRTIGKWSEPNSYSVEASILENYDIMYSYRSTR